MKTEFRYFRISKKLKSRLNLKALPISMNRFLPFSLLSFPFPPSSSPYPYPYPSLAHLFTCCYQDLCTFDIAPAESTKQPDKYFDMVTAGTWQTQESAKHHPQHKSTKKKKMRKKSLKKLPQKTTATKSQNSTKPPLHKPSFPYSHAQSYTITFSHAMLRTIAHPNHAQTFMPAQYLNQTFPRDIVRSVRRLCNSNSFAVRRSVSIDVVVRRIARFDFAYSWM